MFQRDENGILNYSETSSPIERAMTSNYLERNDCMPFFKNCFQIQANIQIFAIKFVVISPLSIIQQQHNHTEIEATRPKP